MNTYTLRRASIRGGDANLFLRAALGLALFVAVTWLYWLMQFRVAQAAVSHASAIAQREQMLQGE